MTNETLKTVTVDCDVAVTDAQVWNRQGVLQKLHLLAPELFFLNFSTPCI